MDCVWHDDRVVDLDNVDVIIEWDWGRCRGDPIPLAGTNKMMIMNVNFKIIIRFNYRLASQP
jgi:hypothetical protein